MGDKKRKNKSNDHKTKAKKPKKPVLVTEDSEDSSNEQDENPQLSLDQVKQIAEVEESLNIETKRQKKQKKHVENLEKQKESTENLEIEKNVEYLNKWKAKRTIWKFEKLRQLSIQKNVFSEEKIPTEIWSIALEYLSGSKGAAKEFLIKIAEDTIKEMDDGHSDVNSSIFKIKYTRARDLLQILQ